MRLQIEWYFVELGEIFLKYGKHQMIQYELLAMCLICPQQWKNLWLVLPLLWCPPPMEEPSRSVTFSLFLLLRLYTTVWTMSSLQLHWKKTPIKHCNWGCLECYSAVIKAHCQVTNLFVLQICQNWLNKVPKYDRGVSWNTEVVVSSLLASCFCLAIFYKYEMNALVKLARYTRIQFQYQLLKFVYNRLTWDQLSMCFWPVFQQCLQYQTAKIHWKRNKEIIIIHSVL